MTRIVLDPDRMVDCANLFAQAGGELESLRFRTGAIPTGAMPAQVAARVSEELGATQATIQALVEALTAESQDLKLRAEAVQLGLAGQDPSFLLNGLDVLDRYLSPLERYLNPLEDAAPSMLIALVQHPRYFRFRVPVRATSYIDRYGNLIERKAHWRKTKIRFMPKGPRPVLRDGRAILKDARVADGALTFASFLIAADDQWHDDAGQGYSGYTKTWRAAAVGATTAAGGWAGAEGGAVVGATAGAFVGGPVGVVVGGVVGAGIGAVAGSFIGHKIGKELIHLHL